MPAGTLNPTRLFAACRAWALDTVDSTRSSALLRIGLVFLIWSRYANEFVLVRDPSVIGIALSLNFFSASLAMLVGYRTRLATLWMAAVLFTMYFYFGVELGRPWVQHHTYLLVAATFLSALTPAGRSYSFDRYLALRRAARAGTPQPAELGNLFGLRLMMLQLCTMYFWTAFDKLEWVWLSGERLQHIFIWYYHSPTMPEWSFFTPLCAAIACFVVVLEFLLAFGLFVPRLRRWLIPAGIALHLLFYLVLVVKTFSLTCVLLYLAVIPARRVHEFLDA